MTPFNQGICKISSNEGHDSNITLDQFANHLTNVTLNQGQINEVEAERDLIFIPTPDESSSTALNPLGQ